MLERRIQPLKSCAVMEAMPSAQRRLSCVKTWWSLYLWIDGEELPVVDARTVELDPVEMLIVAGPTVSVVCELS